MRKALDEGITRWLTSAGALLVVIVGAACSSPPSPNPSTCQGFVNQPGCSVNNDCCTNTCNAGICSCAAYGGDCASDSDCCDSSNNCKNGDGTPVDGSQLGTCY